MRKLILNVILLSQIVAQEMLLDTFIAGKYNGSYLFEESNKNLYIKNAKLCYNKCCTQNSLLKIASDYQIVEDRLYIYPHKKCLSLYGKKKDENLEVKSDSFLLDYKFEHFADHKRLIIEPQFYHNRIYGYFRIDESGVKNPFLLHIGKKSLLQIGFINPFNPSALVRSTSIYGIGIFSNRWQKKNNGVQIPLEIYSPSTVEIYVDDQFVTRKFYEPGIYFLESIPLLYQSGNIHIVIVEENGRRRNIDVPFVNAPSLMKKGALEYGLFVGKKGDRVLSNGYFLYGKDNQINLLGSFNQEKISMGGSLAGNFGTIMGEIDNRGDSYLNYSYILHPFSFYTSWKLSGVQDLRIRASMVNGLGNFSIYYHKNGTDFYQLAFSKSFKHFQLASFVEYDSLNKTSFKFSLTIPFYSLADKRGLLAFNHNREENSLRVFYPKYQGKKEDWGMDIYRFRNGYDAKLDLRYYNDFWLRSANTHASFGVSGSLGCIKVKGIQCGIGEYIPVKESFVIENGFIKSQPPYFNTRLTASFGDKRISLYPGQGYFLDENVFNNLTGKIFLDGVPLKNSYFVIGDRRSFTGLDGSFWVENLSSIESLKVKLDGIEAQCHINRYRKIENGVYEGNINCIKRR